MNEIATRPSSALAVAPDKNAFEAYAEATSRNRIVGELLKFAKGEFSVGSGSEARDIEEGTTLIANLDELMIGWVKWQDGKPVDMQMGRVVDGYQPPRRAELGDTDQEDWETDDRGDPRDPWQLTNYLIFKDPEGDQLFTFATSSKGGIGAIGKLAGLYGKHMRQKPDEFPLVALNVESYRHSNKAYGKIFTPSFDVEGWVGKDGFAEALAAEEAAARDEDDDEDEAPPPPPAKKASAGKPAAASTRF